MCSIGVNLFGDVGLNLAEKLLTVLLKLLVPYSSNPQERVSCHRN